MAPGVGCARGMGMAQGWRDPPGGRAVWRRDGTVSVDAVSSTGAAHSCFARCRAVWSMMPVIYPSYMNRIRPGDRRTLRVQHSHVGFLGCSGNAMMRDRLPRPAGEISVTRCRNHSSPDCGERETMGVPASDYSNFWIAWPDVTMVGL
jgi:hypothetical protein